MGLFNLFRKKNMDTGTVKAKYSIKSTEQIRATDAIDMKIEIPSLTDLIAAATPSKQGLYPHEILMLNYAPTYKISENTFQKFWLYDYGVNDPQTVLNYLLDMGFIDVGEIKDTLQRQTVSELKIELSKMGAKTTGNKEKLIERILEIGGISSLESRYPDKYFVLTGKGRQEICDNEYVIYLHRNRYMSIWEMNKLINDTAVPNVKYRDIIWREFNRQSLEYINNLDFGLYRNIRLSMYYFLMEENRYKNAFSRLCEVLYIDFSGLGNKEIFFFGYDIELRRFSFEQKLKSCFPYEKSTIKIAPGIKENLVDLKKKLEMDSTTLEKALCIEFEKCHLPYHVFTVYECVEIVMGELNNQIDKVERIYKTAEIRMMKEYDSIQ